MRSKAYRIIGAAAASVVMAFSAAVCANAAEVSDQPQEESSEIYSLQPVSSLTVSAAEIFEGESVAAEITTENGGGEYTYTYQVTNRRNKEVISSDTSSLPAADIVFDKPGYYSIKVTVSDDSGYEETLSKNIMVKEALPLQDNGSALSKTRVTPGATVTATADFTGGVKPYKYRFIMSDLTAKTVVEKTALSDSPTAEFKVPENGAAFYHINAIVTDARGNTRSAIMDLLSYQKNPASVSLGGSTASAKEIGINGTVQLTAKASGGTAPYKYLYSYKGETGSWKFPDTTYVYNSQTSIKLPSKVGKYTLRIGIKDMDGKYTEKTFPVEVKNFSIDKSFISSSTSYVGSEVTLRAVASCPNGAVRYHYSIHEPGKDWEYHGGYTYNNVHTFKFDKAGTYYLRVGAKDKTGNGTYKEKQFTVNVVELNVSASVDKTIAKTGEKITLISKVTNNNGIVKYHYSYHADGKDWTYMGDYKKSTSQQFSFSEAGTYFLRVGVKDKNGSGMYKEKQLRVDVYDPNAKATTVSSVLQKDSNWKSNTICTVPSGSKVTVIKSEGRWYYVNYGGKLGYLYNMAFGTAKNYSTIDTSSLPAIADDIIFSKGKNVKNLFNYVNGMGYVAVRTDTLENLCVYILKYRRGACFHRAALLYYLLDRSGYEVIRVDDAVDMYTGGGPHNWCIMKTEQGWRHIDPTPVTGLRVMYLVTDSAIAPYFRWNRQKYPVCN